MKIDPGSFVRKDSSLILWEEVYRTKEKLCHKRGKPAFLLSRKTSEFWKYLERGNARGILIRKNF